MDELTMFLWVKNKGYQRLLDCIAHYYGATSPLQKTAAKDTAYLELMLIYDESKAKVMISLLFPGKGG